MSSSSRAKVQTQALHHNPLEGEQLLLDAMYGKQAPARAKRVETRKPEHYKIVSFSLYLEDIERLEEVVKELKRRGHHKANKSQVVREALMQLDLDAVSNKR